MCTGAELLMGAQIFGGVAGGVSALSGALGDKPKAMTSDPAADAARASDLASQDAAKAKLDTRRRARANSLLSAYSGDEQGKATLGA
ncbi:MAG: hypothetical protein IT530_15065 [Burkholderiales bacterium]|nr:hypothetical protein [Burkholderiales bacterium]